MIRFTNDTHDFFENHNEEIVLWGAGNAGYFVGNYMDRCGMNGFCYVDENRIHDGVVCNGKRVYKPNELLKIGKKYRIVITPYIYQPILDQIAEYDWRVKGLDLLCLLPKFKSIEYDAERYNINKLLSYFRNKLITAPMPTFISNNCIAGHIYDLTDSLLQSPTINTGFGADAYLKFCENYRHYMDCTPEGIHTFRFADQNNGTVREEFAAYLDDIEVCFGHNYKAEDIVERWGLLSKRCDKENIVFILSDYHFYLTPDIRKRFARLPKKHYTIYSRCGVIDPSIDAENSIYLNHYIFDWHDRAIENVFDLVGWINSMGER